MIKNEIISKIIITDYYLNVKIINSFKNVRRENREEICEIFINDKKIDFTNYILKIKGKYIIKYKFKKLLNSTNFMFSYCKSLSSIDISNFNTQNVTNMEYMFYECNSLSSIDLSNFNTKNI